MILTDTFAMSARTETLLNSQAIVVDEISWLDKNLSSVLTGRMTLVKSSTSSMFRCVSPSAKRVSETTIYPDKSHPCRGLCIPSTRCRPSCSPSAPRVAATRRGSQTQRRRATVSAGAPRQCEASASAGESHAPTLVSLSPKPHTNGARRAGGTAAP